MPDKAKREDPHERIMRVSRESIDQSWRLLRESAHFVAPPYGSRPRTGAPSPPEPRQRPVLIPPHPGGDEAVGEPG
jgi:hypothetical protein